MIDLGNLITTLLTYYLPIPDPTTRMNMALALGQAAGALFQIVWKFITKAGFWRRLAKYNTVTIGSDHSYF